MKAMSRAKKVDLAFNKLSNKEVNELFYRMVDKNLRELHKVEI